MKVFGEIVRFKENNIQYIFMAHKHTYKQKDIPWLDFSISRKSAKKTRGTQMSKEDRAYSLVGDTPISVLRKAVSEVAKYLESFESGSTIAVYPYKDDYTKRLKFYSSVLAKMGWFKSAQELIDNDFVVYFTKS